MHNSISQQVDPNEHFFFALQPPLTARAVMVEQLDRVVREHALGGRSVRFGDLHVALCGVGRTARPREAVLPVLRSAAQSVRAAPVEVSFDRLTSFRLGGHSHALVLRGTSTTCTALRFLRTAIGHAQYAQGLYQPAASRFEAHVTLRHMTQPMAAEIALEAITWQAQEFVLMRSVAGHGVHEVVERWPLEPDSR